jgi:hypothetical protein
LNVLSWPGEMMLRTRSRLLQLRLDLAECPAPATTLWELLGEPKRQAAMALLAALIARAVAREDTVDE